MKRIIIVGAGYGGLRAAEHLCKHPELQITLVDQNPYHYMQTEAYGFIAGRFDMIDVAINIRAFADGLSSRIAFIKARAEGIDLPAKALRLEGGERVAYDYLIIAVGARTNFHPFIKGAREHSYGVKHIDRALGFRTAFEARLYKKLQDGAFEHDGDLHIAVAGAGLSGVEIAAEMADVLQSYAKILPDENTRFRISLIDAADTILPGMPPFVIEETRKRLEALGVTIRTGAFISEISEHRILFKGGDSVDFDFMIYTAGIKGSDFVDAVDTEKNRLNQIIPDPYLRVPGHDDIFSIGDCTQIVDGGGNLLPPTAQIAERSAAYVADAIRRTEAGKPLKPFDGKVDGVFVALGGRYAVGVLYGRIRIKGYSAYLFKKLITRLYRLGLELKINAGFRNRHGRR